MNFLDILILMYKDKQKALLELEKLNFNDLDSLERLGQLLIDMARHQKSMKSKKH